MTLSSPRTTEEPFSQDIFCQDCGYNLRGLTGGKCPECGRSLAGLRSDVSQIPWVHRKNIGRFRAYWKTVWMVMFRQRRFCDEMVRPVSYRDSQSFRWTTVATTSLFFLSILATAYVTTSPSSVRGNDLAESLYSLVYPVIAAFFGIVLWLCVCTGLPSYFFHPKTIETRYQNRAIALSYYACGPLVLLGVPIVFLDAAMAISRGDEVTTLLCLIFAMTLPMGPVAAWWIDLIHLTRRLLPQRPSRAFWVGVLVPIFWLLSGVLLVVVVPGLLMYPFLIYLSLNN